MVVMAAHSPGFDPGPQVLSLSLCSLTMAFSRGAGWLCRTAPPNPGPCAASSPWGDFHYKTFDGDVFRFPGLCNYVLSMHCGAAYEDFNIQVRRGLAGSRPTITHIILKTQGLVLEASNGSILINGQR